MKLIIGLLLVPILMGHGYGVLPPPMNYTNGDGMGFVHHSYKAVWPDSRREKGFGIMPLNGSIAA